MVAAYLLLTFVFVFVLLAAFFFVVLFVKVCVLQLMSTGYRKALNNHEQWVPEVQLVRGA